MYLYSQFSTSFSFSKKYVFLNFSGWFFNKILRRRKCFEKSSTSSSIAWNLPKNYNSLKSLVQCMPHHLSYFFNQCKCNICCGLESRTTQKQLYLNQISNSVIWLSSMCSYCFKGCKNLFNIPMIALKLQNIELNRDEKVLWQGKILPAPKFQSIYL